MGRHADSWRELSLLNTAGFYNPHQNLNSAIGTTNPRYYQAARRVNDRQYTLSPDNWRNQTCYTVMLDKFADGDPSNNDIFQTSMFATASGTVVIWLGGVSLLIDALRLDFEYDSQETHFRAGGDILGLRSKIGYLTEMGITCVYLAGTPFASVINGVRTCCAC
jgi:alpha-1,3-glucan synthase